MAATTGMLNAVMSPITGKDGDTLDMKQAKAVALAYSVAGMAVGSIVARNRAAAGHEPLLKVFF